MSLDAAKSKLDETERKIKDFEAQILDAISRKESKLPIGLMIEMTGALRDRNHALMQVDARQLLDTH